MNQAQATPVMTNAEYHRHPAISKSHLDAVAKSPRHYWARYVDPNRAPEPYNPAFAIGSAAHAAILEPDVYARDFAVAPAIDKRTKAGKEEWEAFQKANAKKTVISLEDHQLVIAMAAAVRNHPAALELLSEGEAERSVIAKDPETEAEIKCRPDWLRSDGRVIDIKTTEDASESGFAKSIANFRYHVQAAWYMDTMEAAYGEPPSDFLFIAVEKKAPHVVGVYRIGFDSLSLGRRLARRDLRLLLDCKASGIWPGYGGGAILDLDVPAWAMRG